MEFLKLALKRRSLRRYAGTPVPPEMLLRALEAARLAPSASNSQPWHFIVVDDPEIRRQLGRACRGPVGSFNRFAEKVPAFIVILENRGSLKTAVGGALKGRRYSRYDIGIAAEHICLQATEDGLGSCMLGWFDERRIRKLLKVQGTWRPSLVITLGFPAAESREDPPPKRRKEWSEVVSWDFHGETRHTEGDRHADSTDRGAERAEDPS